MKSSWFPVCLLKNLDWYKQCYSQKYVCSIKISTDKIKSQSRICIILHDWVFRSACISLKLQTVFMANPKICLFSNYIASFRSPVQCICLNCKLYLSQIPKYICLKLHCLVPVTRSMYLSKCQIVAPSGHHISAALS